MRPSSSASSASGQPIFRAARRRAFTLIELLTVIAIIGILAAILIPTTAKVRASARRAQCASNLRQIHAAISLYADENRGMLPFCHDRVTNRSWWEKNSPLARHVGGDLSLQRLAVCPENLTDAPIPGQDGYGRWVKNEYGYGYTVNYQLMPNEDGATAVNLSRVTKPSQTVLMADSVKGEGWGEGFKLSTNLQHLSRIGTPHGAKANILWADGHVTLLDKIGLEERTTP